MPRASTRFLNPTGETKAQDERVRLDFSQFQKQRDFIYDLHRITAAVTGIGGAKTTSGAAKVVSACDGVPGTRALITAPTFSQLEQATMRKIRELIPPGRIAAFNKNEHMLTLVNGSEIIYQSAENPDHFRGPEYGIFWPDEASYISEEAFLVGVGRVRQPGVFRQIIITGTPAGKNWMYRLLEPAILNGGVSPDGRISFHTWTTFDNPHLPEDAVETQKQLYTGTDFYEQDLLGVFKTFSGLVYQHNPMSLIDTTPGGPWKRSMGGVDFGATSPYAHASAALVVVEDHASRFYVVAEYYRRQAPIEEMAVWMMEQQQKWGVTRWEGDKSQQIGIQLLAQGGLNIVQTPPPSVVTVLDGIGIIQRRFASNGLFINRHRCPATVAELSQYQWREEKAGQEPKTEPLKIHDDAMDALRYAVVALERDSATGSRQMRRFKTKGRKKDYRAAMRGWQHLAGGQRRAA